ncbi:MAG: S-adenosylhomocysteine deaminase, partial [Deltaproteobacteria bacterium]|nr:S-adenosylhomocysteine deaminase [Deltaproteobacteria bacterium]
MKPKSADILILNGTILTMDITDTILKDGGLAIVQDRIAAIGPAAEFSGWRAARVIDAGGGIIMPGL